MSDVVVEFEPIRGKWRVMVPIFGRNQMVVQYDSQAVAHIAAGQIRQYVQQQLAEKGKRIAELEPLAKCALELRKWFLDNEFWNDENSEDIFPILEKHGLVECVEYDPAIHNCDNNEPGDTIWYFPPLAGESV